MQRKGGPVGKRPIRDSYSNQQVSCPRQSGYGLKSRPAKKADGIAGQEPEWGFATAIRGRAESGTNRLNTVPRL